MRLPEQNAMSDNGGFHTAVGEGPDCKNGEGPRSMRCPAGGGQVLSDSTKYRGIAVPQIPRSLELSHSPTALVWSGPCVTARSLADPILSLYRLHLN